MVGEPTGQTPWCPSARPERPGAVVFGVRTSATDDVRIGYLDHAVPASGELLGLAGPVDPLEVFRFGAPCVESGCAHFAEGRCGLATRISNELPVVSVAPACALRSHCRWWAQEGSAACQRCPAVVTRESGRNATIADVARVRSSEPPEEAASILT